MSESFSKLEKYRKEDYFQDNIVIDNDYFSAIITIHAYKIDISSISFIDDVLGNQRIYVYKPVQRPYDDLEKIISFKNALSIFLSQNKEDEKFIIDKLDFEVDFKSDFDKLNMATAFSIIKNLKNYFFDFMRKEESIKKYEFKIKTENGYSGEVLFEITSFYADNFNFENLNNIKKINGYKSLRTCDFCKKNIDDPCSLVKFSAFDKLCLNSNVNGYLFSHKKFRRDICDICYS